MPETRKTRRDALKFFNMSDDSNVKFVVDHSLCHGCGTCEAVCPTKAISMEYDEDQGIILPSISEPDCTNCGDCVRVCSGFELDLKYRPWQEDQLENHDLIGPYKNIYRSYTLDNPRRELSTSGGLATEIVASLLETEVVDAAILVKMSEEKPLRAEGYIAETVDEIKPSHKSKYCPVALNIIIRDLIFSKGAECSKKYVFVGLPHHVHGLRLAQDLHPELKDKIPFVVSLFTAHTPSQKATEFLLYKKGILPEHISSLEYRGGGSPGRMTISKKDGTDVYVPHLDRIYSGHVFPLFFYPIREWLYFDKISEWADFSCGDNWMREHQDQLGVSTVITRSKKADQIILDLRSKGRIHALEMSADQLVRDQGLTKKLDISSRLTVWKMLGKKTPHYTRNFVGRGRVDIRTVRFALFVLLTSRKMKFRTLDLVITIDYYLRALPLRKSRELKSNILKLLSMLKISKSKKKWPQKENKKFILIGGYGHDDIGDEAMPHAVRINLRSKFGTPTEINMFSVDPLATAARHNEKSQHDFNLISCGRNASWKARIGTKAFMIMLVMGAFLERLGLRVSLWPTARAAIDEIISADAIVNVGGGNLNSIMPDELYKKCTTYLVAHILRRPVYLTGQTIGPFYGVIDGIFAKYCLNTVKAISLRDSNTSRTRLQKIGVTKPIIFDSADDAITLEANSTMRAYEILSRETALTKSELDVKPLIVLNMKASLRQFKGDGRSGSLEHEISVMSALADRLINTYDANIVFVGTDFSHNADDREVHKLVIKGMQSRKNVFSLDGRYEDKDLIAIIKLASLVIGSRYHFNVFAASQKIPFIGFASGLYQMTKLEGLANLVGIKNCFLPLDMEFSTIEDIWPQVETVFENRKEIINKLRVSTSQLKLKSRMIYDLISDDLDKA